jgi:hypothetical protein
MIQIPLGFFYLFLLPPWLHGLPAVAHGLVFNPVSDAGVGEGIFGKARRAGIFVVWPDTNWKAPSERHRSQRNSRQDAKAQRTPLKFLNDCLQLCDLAALREISFRGGCYNYAAPLALEWVPNAV